jgi:hypothetical protein
MVVSNMNNYVNTLHNFPLFDLLPSEGTPVP